MLPAPPTPSAIPEALRLPFHFDAGGLREDLEQFLASEFVPRFNIHQYSGDWSVKFSGCVPGWCGWCAEHLTVVEERLAEHRPGRPSQRLNQISPAAVRLAHVIDKVRVH
jgi:hypothetical protein